MSNALYPLWKQELLKGTANTSPNAGNVKALLILSTYTYSATHQFISDLSATIATSGRSANMTTKTFTNGVFDADDVTWTTPAASQSIKAVVLAIDTGTDSTSPLMCYLDTATGLTLTTSGGNIIATWDNGSNKIFAL
jgi:hypothetical protein